MIDPAGQWCIHIEVTNQCPRACSNCTRLTGHARRRWRMSPEQFGQAVDCLADFPHQSTPDRFGRNKTIGIMGGEPLLHPSFPLFCRMLAAAIPRRNRGLWTGLDLHQYAHRELVEKTFRPIDTANAAPNHPRLGYLNHNTHTGHVIHQPALCAPVDLVPDPVRRAHLIAHCWLQEQWSSAITPRGFFFCEVAAAFDSVFEGPGGLPVEPGVWKRPLADFADQIDRWCNRCGICLPLPARDAAEEVDDVTETNRAELERLGSPRIRAGRFRLFDAAGYDPAAHVDGWHPARYLLRRAKPHMHD